MKHVDAFSIHPVMNITYDEITAKIKNDRSNDEYITTIKQLVESGKVNDFQIRNDILFKLVDGKELLVIPDSMQTEIIKRAHDKGHFAVVKTEQIISLDYYFPKLSRSKMKTKDFEIIIQLLNERLMQELEEMRHDAKVNIQHVQDINKAQFYKKRKQPHVYKKANLWQSKEPSSVQD
ncbi:retrovirus-related Pol polyprotein from transposon 17.6 [Trichonephila clavipes]|nr:retrovirus-related Pol polyprotein from transposon 17.6 [Trichonephila clavipes]